MGPFTETAIAAFRMNDRGETLFHAPLFHFRNRRAYVVRSEEDAGRIRRKLRAFLRIFTLMVVPAMVVATGRAFGDADLLPRILVGLAVGTVCGQAFRLVALRPVLRTLERSSETLRWREALEIQAACYSRGTLLFFSAFFVLTIGIGIVVLSSGRTSLGICGIAIGALLGFHFAWLMVLKRRP